LDGSLITLQGSPFRLLHSPLQTVHQPADMVAMILDSELALDHLGNASRGPQIRPVTMGWRPASQFLLQPLALRSIQLPRASWRKAHPQSLGSTVPPGITPAHHRTGIASNPPPYFVEQIGRAHV
jgi:hypothetical protein